MRSNMYTSKVSFCVLTVTVVYVSAFNYDRSQNDIESEKMDPTVTLTTGFSPFEYQGQNDIRLKNNQEQLDYNTFLNDDVYRIQTSDLLIGRPLNYRLPENNEKHKQEVALSDRSNAYVFLDNEMIDNMLVNKPAKPVINRNCIDNINCESENIDTLINTISDESYSRDIRKSNENVGYQLTILSDEQTDGDNFVRSKDKNKRKLNADIQHAESEGKRTQGSYEKADADTLLKEYVFDKFNNNSKQKTELNKVRNNSNYSNVNHESQNITYNGLTSGATRIVEHKRLFGGVGPIQARCELDTFAIDMTFSEHMEMETGDYMLTCRGSVTVNKCEGMCRSHVTPSVNHRDGFVKECACCRDSATQTRSVTLTTCVLGSNEEVGYSLSRDIIEPTECSCKQCRN